MGHQQGGQRPVVNLSVRIDPDLAAAIDTIVRDSGLSKNAWVEQALKAAVDRDFFRPSAPRSREVADG